MFYVLHLIINIVILTNISGQTYDHVGFKNLVKNQSYSGLTRPIVHISALMSEVPSSSQLSIASEDTGLDEESESCDIKSQSADSETASSTNGSEMDKNEPKSADSSNNATESEKIRGIVTQLSEEDTGVVFSADTEYSNIEIGDIQDDKSEQSNMSNINTGSQETLLSIKSLSPTHNKAEGRLEVMGQDLNGNPELIVDSDVPEPISPSPDTSSVDILKGIGSLTEGMPLLYCVRLICRRFLLTGLKEELIPDRKVRVSVKSLALANIGYAVTLCPRIFLETLFELENHCK